MTFDSKNQVHSVERDTVEQHVTEGSSFSVCSLQLTHIRFKICPEYDPCGNFMQDFPLAFRIESIQVELLLHSASFGPYVHTHLLL